MEEGGFCWILSEEVAEFLAAFDATTFAFTTQQQYQRRCCYSPLISLDQCDQIGRFIEL